MPVVAPEKQVVGPSAKTQAGSRRNRYSEFESHGNDSFQRAKVRTFRRHSDLRNEADDLIDIAAAFRFNFIIGNIYYRTGEIGPAVATRTRTVICARRRETSGLAQAASSLLCFRQQ